MINKDRIVPVTKTDLLTLYSAMLTIAGTEVKKLSDDIPGDFKVTEDGTYMADQPVKTLALDTACVVYMMPALDFIGVTAGNRSITPADLESLGGNCGQLYKITYTTTAGTGSLTLQRIGL